MQQTFADFLDVELGVSDLLLGGLMRSVADAAQPASSLFLADAFLDSSGEITEAAFADEFAMVRRLHKTALLLNRLRVPAEELAFLFAERATYGWLDFNALPLSEADSPAPFDTWRRMAELALLEEALPAGETSVFDLLRMAEAGGDASAFDAFLRWRAHALGRNDLDTLLDGASAWTTSTPTGRGGRWPATTGRVQSASSWAFRRAWRGAGPPRRHA